MDRIKDLFRQAEATLDHWGKPGWIGAMVLGFILVWPIGLALLFYMLWSGRMGRNCGSRRQHRWSRKSGTGNSAFDAYREETLRRLEDEQAAFEGFLERLRAAKDKTEFDLFMDERRRGGPTPKTPEPEPAPGPFAGGPTPAPACPRPVDGTRFAARRSPRRAARVPASLQVSTKRRAGTG